MAADPLGNPLGGALAERGMEGANRVDGGADPASGRWGEASNVTASTVCIVASAIRAIFKNVALKEKAELPVRFLR